MTDGSSFAGIGGRIATVQSIGFLERPYERSVHERSTGIAVKQYDWLTTGHRLHSDTERR